ncbi:MAG: N-acetyltransferase [Thermodesulfovibrionia bacterium]|nr:N-acetyltransferase [Thermodesulfovibrionia bacterium]
MMNINKATIKDVRGMQSLINNFAKKDLMLPRSLNEIYENIRDFYVCVEDDRVIAVSALHVLWEDIAEIKSLVVANEYQGQGIGKKLIKKCLKEATALGLKKVFALTYKPEFFINQGFKEIDKNSLPQKIWGECMKCHKFPECDESSVLIEL